MQAHKEELAGSQARGLAMQRDVRVIASKACFKFASPENLQQEVQDCSMAVRQATYLLANH